MRNGMMIRHAYNPRPDVFADFDRLFEGFLAPRAEREARIELPYEIEEHDGFYLLSFDVPGVNKDDIQIEVHEQNLRVSGERKRGKTEDKGLFRRTERAYGRFERAFTLPKSIDANRVEARYENGVLELMLPKVEEAKPRTIKIQDEAGAGTGLFGQWLSKRKDEKTN